MGSGQKYPFRHVSKLSTGIQRHLSRVHLGLRVESGGDEPAGDRFLSRKVSAHNVTSLVTFDTQRSCISVEKSTPGPSR